MGARRNFTLDTESVQHIPPLGRRQRFEGVAFSSSAEMIGIAAPDMNGVLLFRRRGDGRFEENPFQVIEGIRSGLNYPHDVSFCRCGTRELLAVAQRAGAISIFARIDGDEGFRPEPVCDISGPQAKLAFSDGVAFVPPDNRYLAACNLELGTISFYRMTSAVPVKFETTPEFELTHSSIYHPDGLAFSASGKWLATANHGCQSVSVFRRSKAFGPVSYGPEPATVIDDPHLRYPHSVAFTPKTNHLIATNAGANYICVYGPQSSYFPREWRRSPVSREVIAVEAAFKEVNSENKMEGGPKGVAVSGKRLVVCSPEFGAKIYSFSERRYLWRAAGST